MKTPYKANCVKKNLDTNKDKDSLAKISQTTVASNSEDSSEFGQLDFVDRVIKWFLRLLFKRNY